MFGKVKFQDLVSSLPSYPQCYWKATKVSTRGLLTWVSPAEENFVRFTLNVHRYAIVKVRPFYFISAESNQQYSLLSKHLHEPLRIKTK